VRRIDGDDVSSTMSTNGVDLGPMAQAAAGSEGEKHG
jgi:hypothetical protein